MTDDMNNTSSGDSFSDAETTQMPPVPPDSLSENDQYSSQDYHDAEQTEHEANADANTEMIDPETRAYSQVSDEDDPNDTSTRMIPVYPDYDPDTDSGYEGEDPDKAEAHRLYGAFRWENIPFEDKTEEWVRRNWYERLFDSVIESGEYNARLLRQYNEAIRQNNMLRDTMEANEQQINREKDENRLARDRIDADRKRLDEDRQEFDSHARKDRIIKICLGIATAILGVLTITFLLMWLGERGDRANEAQSNTASQSQVQQLKDELDKTRQDRDQQGADNKTLNEKVDSLNKQLSDARGVSDGLKSESGDKDKKIDDLNSQVEQLKSAPPSTVTETKTSESDPKTITSTVTGQGGSTDTSTVTVTRGNSGN